MSRARPSSVRLGALLAGLLAACGPSGGATPELDGGQREDDADPLRPGDGGDDGCTESIDVVFVLDVSSSMNFVLEDLEDNIAGVVAAANALAPDAHFGLVAFADNAALDLGGDREGGAVHTSAATLVDAFADVRTTYTGQNRNPGDGPAGPTTQNPICEENAPDALHLAATGFPWRENTTRVIIAATDDTFLAPPDNYGDRDGDGDTTSPDFPREGDYPAAHGIVDTSAELRSREIRVFSVTRLAEPSIFDLGRCGTGRRLEWADITDGWTTPYDGAPPFPAATDGANFDLDAVRDGSLSLAETINQVVVDSHCNDVE